MEGDSLGRSGGDSFNDPTTATATSGAEPTPTGPGTNVSLGGSQDIGFFRGQLEAGLVPRSESLDAAGFFAEHHADLPPPACGQRICLQPMVAVMGNLMTGADCTMLHLGLNSPLTADPGARPPLTLSVVVDVSGSMAGEKLDFVKSGLELLIDGMKDDDQLSLVSYSDQARIVSETTAVAGNRVALRQAIRDLAVEGSTNLEAGLRAGYTELMAHYDSSRQNRVILLSDGVPTAGVTASGPILEMSRGYNSHGVGLTTIGLGADFNIELMRDLALQADGNFYFLEDTGAVSEVFTEELSYFVVPVAFDLKLSVAEGEAFRFGRALGTPFWVDTETGGELEVPSVFLAHRESDTDVTDSDGRRGGGSQLLIELMARDTDAPEDSTIATVQVSFRDPTTQETVEDLVDIRYPHKPGVLMKEGYFEADDLAAAQKSFVMLNIYVGMENAILGFEQNRSSTTIISELDNLIFAVEDYNEEIKDKDIELDLELLDMLRDNLVQSGAPDSNAPPVEDPWPAD